MSGVFALPWGATAAMVRTRFEGLAPLDATPNGLSWALESVAARLYAENAFCPSLFAGCGPDHTVSFVLQDDQLLAIDVTFGNTFEALGHDPDTLSDMAMAAVCRVEVHDLLQQLTAKYGAPVQFADQPSRRGKMQGVCSALFVAADATTLGLWVGHDHAGLVGKLSYLCPVQDQNGF